MAQDLYVHIYLQDDGWVPAGLLQHEEAGRLSFSSFRYGIKYLERPNAISIDPIQLPLVDQTFTTPEGFSLFNGIRDAGPDRWGRYLLDREFARTLTETEYVAATSPDRAGALAFSDNPRGAPKMLTPNGFQKASLRRFDLAFCVGAIQDTEKSEQTERLKEYLKYGPSLGGARPKATVTWNGKPYIAKFSLSMDHRNEPLVEFAAMTLANKCGLRVPRIDKTEVADRSVYLIERFDRDPQENPIPFVSGLTITGTHESDYGYWSYHSLVDAIVKFSPRPEEDLEELFRRMVFNILVYNNDDHLRNFGFLHAGKDRWQLSPLYDVVPATVNSETYALAMIIGSEGKKASIANALSLCERFRISKDRANTLIKTMQKEIGGWKELFRKCGVSQTDITRLEKNFVEK